MSAPPSGPSKANAAGDGVRVGVDSARGAQRTGRNIWILVISLALAVVLLIGYWLLHASHMQAISHPQARDESTRDANSYRMQAGGARAAPPGEPSTTGASR